MTAALVAGKKLGSASGFRRATPASTPAAARFAAGVPAGRGGHSITRAEKRQCHHHRQCPEHLHFRTSSFVQRGVTIS